MKLTEREKAIYQVTWAGSFVNFLLVISKFIAGILGHSAAMIADAVHSLSDFATDIVVLIFTRISNKPQDKNHDYGHGKYETLATAIIGIVLFAVGASICWNGLQAIQTVWQGGRLPAPGMLAFAGAIISIVSKELIYRYTIHVGRKINSSAVIANAWHHRSDAFSSIGTAIGIGGAIVLGESWSVLDPMAAVVVSFFIMKVAVQLLKPCVDELTEKSLPNEIEKEICLITENTPGVSAIHNLRTRRIGNHYAIEMHIRMDGHLTLYEAHAKASVIENKLKEKYGNETHVGIHVEPVKSADGTYRE
mgnify:CR=1 FL=1